MVDAGLLHVCTCHEAWEATTETSHGHVSRPHVCSVLLAMRSEGTWLHTMRHGWSRGVGRTSDIVGGQYKAVCVVTSALLRHLPVLPVLLGSPCMSFSPTDFAPARRLLGKSLRRTVPRAATPPCMQRALISVLVRARLRKLDGLNGYFVFACRRRVPRRSMHSYTALGTFWAVGGAGLQSIY